RAETSSSSWSRIAAIHMRRFQMSEITPELVVKALKQQNLRPVYRSWGDGRTCGCALTALEVAAGKQMSFLSDPLSNVDEREYFAKAFGRTLQEIEFFLRGFDQTGPSPSEEATAGERSMYELGVACYAAVKSE